MTLELCQCRVCLVVMAEAKVVWKEVTGSTAPCRCHDASGAVISVDERFLLYDEPVLLWQGMVRVHPLRDSDELWDWDINDLAGDGRSRRAVAMRNEWISFSGRPLLGSVSGRMRADGYNDVVLLDDTTV